LKQVPGWKAFPTTVIVDRMGRVRTIVTENSTNTIDFIGDVVRILLAEPATKPEAGAAKKPSEAAAAAKKPSEPVAAAKKP
jgi:hypothetical protein